MKYKVYRDPKSGKFVNRGKGISLGITPEIVERGIKERRIEKIETLRIKRTKFSGNYVMQSGKVVREEDATGPRSPLPIEWMATIARRREYANAHNDLHKAGLSNELERLIANIEKGHGVDRQDALRIATRVLAQDRFNNKIDDIEVSPKGGIKLW